MRYVIAIVAFLNCGYAWAGNVTVTAAWARASAPGQASAAVYLRIVSQQAARLVAVTSPLARSAEIHSMTHDNGIMKMRALEALPLPAQQEVELGSGGTHLMLQELKRPLKVGGTVPLVFTIQFADGHKERVKVKAEVKPFTFGQKGHEHQHPSDSKQ